MKIWDPNTDDSFNHKPRFSILRAMIIGLLCFVVFLGFAAIGTAEEKGICITPQDFTVEQITIRAMVKFTPAPLIHGKGFSGVYALILYFAGEKNGGAAMFIMNPTSFSYCKIGGAIIVPIDELKKEIGAEKVDAFNRLHATKS